jgi:hypothetical protein
MRTQRFGRKIKLPATIAIKHQIRVLMAQDDAPRVSGTTANTNTSPITPTHASSKKVIGAPDVSATNPARVVLNEAPMPTAVPTSP